MFDLTRTLALTLAVAAAVTHPALAQETSGEQPATEQPADPNALPMGEEVTAKPELYIKSTHGDWQLRCVRMEDGSDPCELFQLLKDDKGNSVAEMTMVALTGGEAAAGATVIVPLETLLTEQLTLTIDSGKARRYPFTFCASVGCFARLGFTGEDVEAMKKGSQATISVVPMVAPDQTVKVSASLKGFTDAFEAVKAEMPQP
jgi:invasion protein IalB